MDSSICVHIRIRKNAIRMHIHAYTHVYIQRYIHAYACTYIPECIHTYVDTYVHGKSNMLLCICSYACTNTRMCAYICVYSYAYVHR